MKVCLDVSSSIVFTARTCNGTVVRHKCLVLRCKDTNASLLSVRYIPGRTLTVRYMSDTALWTLCGHHASFPRVRRYTDAKRLPGTVVVRGTKKRREGREKYIII